MNYGIDIPIAYWTGSDTSPTYHDLTAFPSATLYSTTTPAPRTYNCYTFAFIYDGHVEGFSLLDDSQIFLITQDGSGNENVASYLLSGYSPCMTPTSRDEIVTGDLILYYLLATNENGTDGNMGMNAYTHAAVVTEVNEVIVNGERTVPIENVTVLSKWGTGDLYYHTPTECAYAGEHTNIVYGIGNNEITRTVQLKFFKPNHEYTYTEVS